jgi:predicted RNA-binding protein YlxR (DUF448 family)
MKKRNKRRQPQRMCIVCGNKRAKAELIRLALDEKSKVCLDYRQRRRGRGCYVCQRPECLTRVKLASLEKAFRRSLPQTAWNPALTMAEALQGRSIQLQEQ